MVDARTRVRAPWHYGWVVALILCVACQAPVIEGSVTDVKGDALPGVAVTVEGAWHEALTDALGLYRIRYRPGEVVLRFAKTGYTPGILEARVTPKATVSAASIALWPLPTAAGVYLYEGWEYRALKPTQPRAYLTKPSGTAHGVVRAPELETLDHDPLILSYKLPRYGAKVSRLELTEVSLREAVVGGDSLEIWCKGDSIPASSVPVDEPDGLLVQLRCHETLEPGCYAVHWGALDGDTRIPRIFLFRVGEPEAPGEVESPAGVDGAEEEEGEAPL